MRTENLVPQLGVVTAIRKDTPDIKTFRVNAIGGGKVFDHMPGQCAMLSIPGVGEAMFSITSSPTEKDFQEFSIKKTGRLTDGREPIFEGKKFQEYEEGGSVNTNEWESAGEFVWTKMKNDNGETYFEFAKYKP